MPFILPAIALLLLFVGCSDGTVQRLTITGSSTMAPLMAELARDYEALQPGLRIDVQTGGSSRGLHDVRNGVADIGMVSRALNAQEADLSGHLIARDGLAMITHASNPVTALSSSQVRALFLGHTERWSRIGGRDMPVSLVHKAEGRSTLEIFLGHFALDNRAIRPSVVIGDNEQGIKTVAGNPAAIGYVSIGAAEIAQGRGTAIRLLDLDGVPAHSTEIRAGRYPLVRELNLVTRGTLTPAARDFIAYALSAAAHGPAESLGLLHVGAGAASPR